MGYFSIICWEPGYDIKRKLVQLFCMGVMRGPLLQRIQITSSENKVRRKIFDKRRKKLMSNLRYHLMRNFVIYTYHIIIIRTLKSRKLK
jgi:hypothetical protein